MSIYIKKLKCLLVIKDKQRTIENDKEEKGGKKAARETQADLKGKEQE